MAPSTTHIINHLWLTPELRLPSISTQRLILSGVPETVPSSFRVGAAAQAAIACSALSSAYIHQTRHGLDKPQEVIVDARHAVLDCKSEAWTSLNGRAVGATWDSLSGAYTTRDGHVRVHTNFPHHRKAILNTLDLPNSPIPSREGVAAALGSWDAQVFEDAVIQAGGCAFKIRSFAEWDAHPHGLHTTHLPPLSLRKICDAPSRTLLELEEGDLPLKGVRVLDLTRVIAGPVCGRTLAAHGADVIWITSPSLSDLPAVDIDTSRGKRTIQLDLNDDHDRVTFYKLLKDADVLLQSYRPGSLTRRDPGADVFDSLVQAATGFNMAEAEAYSLANPGTAPHPKLRALPCQILDHAAGHFLVLGINAALGRRIREDGNWHVEVSLLGTANWLRSLGRTDPLEAFGVGSSDKALSLDNENLRREVDNLLVDIPSEQEAAPQLKALRHAAVMSMTPVRVGYAPGGLNMHQPEWLPV